MATLLLLPMLVVDLLLLAAFARTLLPGREPLISRLAALARRAPLDRRSRRYTHALTLFWSGYFLLVSAINGVELLQPAMLPLWLIGLGSLPVCALLMVGEYGLRRLVMPDYGHQTLREFLRFMRRLDRRLLFGAGDVTVLSEGPRQ